MKVNVSIEISDAVAAGFINLAVAVIGAIAL